MTPHESNLPLNPKIDRRKIKPTGVEAYSYKHGHTTGRGASREYSSWNNMITRCTNPNFKDWKYYGGKGIKVCQEWLDSFSQFLSDMGSRPEGTSLDRIDGNGNYEPENCRWATALEQTHNKPKRTHCLRGHLLEGHNVIGPRRHCRACKNAKDNERRRNITKTKRESENGK